MAKVVDCLTIRNTRGKWKKVRKEIHKELKGCDTTEQVIHKFKEDITHIQSGVGIEEFIIEDISNMNMKKITKVISMDFSGDFRDFVINKVEAYDKELENVSGVVFGVHRAVNEVVACCGVDVHLCKDGNDDNKEIVEYISVMILREK